MTTTAESRPTPATAAPPGRSHDPRARLDLHQQLLVLPRADGSSDAPAIRRWS
jgi:hypothetical protein